MKRLLIALSILIPTVANAATIQIDTYLTGRTETTSPQSGDTILLLQGGTLKKTTKANLLSGYALSADAANADNLTSGKVAAERGGAGTITGLLKAASGSVSQAVGDTDYALPATVALKAPIASPTFTGTVGGITSTMIGLGNVTNESKATMFTSPTFTGTVSLPASGATTVRGDFPQGIAQAYEQTSTGDNYFSLLAGNLTTNPAILVTDAGITFNGVLLGSSNIYVSVPTYSDDTCTAGQYALDSSYRYDCQPANTWTRTARTAWNNPAPTAIIGPEDFEGTGEPLNWGHLGTPDYDYTTSPLQGSQSLFMAASSTTEVAPHFSAIGDVYTAALIKVSTLTGGGSEETFRFANAAGTWRGQLILRNDGAAYCQASGGASAAGTTGLLVGGTAKYIKAHYVKGTGANAAMTAWVSDTGATGTWTQLCTSTNGTGTDNIEYAAWVATTLWNTTIDRVIVDSIDINY